MARKKKTYDKSFKQQAIQLALTANQSISQINNQLAGEFIYFCVAGCSFVGSIYLAPRFFSHMTNKIPTRK